MGRFVVVSASLAAAALLVAGGGSARSTQAIKLVGTVGPEFTITLAGRAGQPRHEARSRRLRRSRSPTARTSTTSISRGPESNETTQVEFTGTVTWNVTFTDGTYMFFCDVHPTRMRGTFTVGNAAHTDSHRRACRPARP